MNDLHRRTFLGGLGAATILVASGEVSIAFGEASPSPSPEIPPGSPFEPWRTWRQPSAGPLALVRAAILAANAYNSQPWRFRVSATRIDLLADLRRNLGAFDPYLRELHFSIGCALENLLLAGAAEGYACTLTS